MASHPKNSITWLGTLYGAAPDTAYPWVAVSGETRERAEFATRGGAEHWLGMTDEIAESRRRRAARNQGA